MSTPTYNLALGTMEAEVYYAVDGWYAAYSVKESLYFIGDSLKVGHPPMPRQKRAARMALAIASRVLLTAHCVRREDAPRMTVAVMDLLIAHPTSWAWAVADLAHGRSRTVEAARKAALRRARKLAQGVRPLPVVYIYPPLGEVEVTSC